MVIFEEPEGFILWRNARGSLSVSTKWGDYPDDDAWIRMAKAGIKALEAERVKSSQPITSKEAEAHE